MGAGKDEAQFLTSLHELDGRPCIVDPRNTLSRIVENFSELGLTPVAAIELEFYLMDREAALSGRPKPPAAQLNGAVPKGMQPYLLQDLDDFGPFFDDVYKAGDIQGLPLQTLISEYSPGQMEIGLKHRADPLKACDEAIMYKRLVKAIAEKHGFVATFMAKPYKDLAGSGMHVHVSLVDKNGNNIFASEDPARNLPLRYAIGGLKATMAEAFAVFAPNANSYRRFRKNSYAPVAPTWGVNNRTVSLRIPAGTGQSVHIEHRVAGADANPYLVLAAVLAGMHHGMAAKIDPGPESKGNAYAAPAARMPTNWLDAIELWQRSATDARLLPRGTGRHLRHRQGSRSRPLQRRAVAAGFRVLPADDLREGTGTGPQASEIRPSTTPIHWVSRSAFRCPTGQRVSGHRGRRWKASSPASSRSIPIAMPPASMPPTRSTPRVGCGPTWATGRSPTSPAIAPGSPHRPPAKTRCSTRSSTRQLGKAVAVASYLRIDPNAGSIEIGNICYSPLAQRTPVATESMYLFARHAFDELGYRRYEWKCDSLNVPSRRAAVRLGFTYEGIFRQAVVYKGRNRDTAWYAMIDKEWPALRGAYETWLASHNFDTAGRQRESLGTLTARALGK